MRAYFTPAETGQVEQAIVKRLTPVEAGSMLYWMASSNPNAAETGNIDLASIKAVMTEFLLRSGAPSFVIPLEWHLKLKPCVQKYHEEAVTPAASLFSGKPPAPPQSFLTRCFSACVGAQSPATKQPTPA
jgi:hypothetical protein